MFRVFFARAAALFCAAGLMGTLPSSALAQTINQPSGNSNGSAGGIGQSFTATVTGNLTQIQVRARQNQATTVRFYNGTGSGTNGVIGTPASSQAVTLVDSTSSGFQTIVLATPLPVVAGNQYAFAFDGPVNFFLDTNNPYAGGTFIANYNTPFPAFDLTFTATEVAAAPPAPVPTLSEWAMIILSLTLAGGAAIYIQRRRIAA